MTNRSTMLLVRGALLCLPHLTSHDFPIHVFHVSLRSIGVETTFLFFVLSLPIWKGSSSPRQNLLMVQVMGLWEQQWSGIKMPAEDPPPPAPTREVQETRCHSVPIWVKGPSSSFPALNICHLIIYLSSSTGLPETTLLTLIVSFSLFLFCVDSEPRALNSPL